MIPVQLFTGSDEIVLAEAVRAAIHEALGDNDASLALEDMDESAYFDDPEWTIAPLVDAAQTAPFLTDRRVVVGRHLARFSKQDMVGPLLNYLDNPVPTTALLLVWNKGPKLTARVGGVPRKVTEAVNAAGGKVHKVDVPGGKGAGKWLDDQVKASPVTLDPRARQMLAEHLGENANRLGSILTALASRFEPGTKLTAEDIEPYIGSQGGVPPWELTDAISDGDIALALGKLRRMTEGGDRHPLATMSILTTHFTRLAHLDGARVANEKDAASLLGMKGSTFPAKKALAQSRRMDTDDIRSAVSLLAQADLDLRGMTAIEAPAVMEILVARLSRLCRR